MSYTPNNAIVFAAAFAGAMAGIAAEGRSPVNPSATAPGHVASTAAAGAMAQAFDTAWGTVGVNAFQQLAITSFCEGVMSGRGALSTDPTSYTTTCLAVIAFITAGGNYYAGIGAVPPLAPAVTVLAARNSSAQSIPSNVVTQVTNWTIALDTAAAFDPVAGLWTCPAAGSYAFSGQLAFGQALDLNTLYGLIFNAGALTWSINSFSIVAGNGNGVIGIATQVVTLAKGATAKFSAFHVSAAARALLNVGLQNFWTIVQVA